MKNINLWRHVCQLSVIAIFIIIPWLNFHNWQFIHGNLFALNIWSFPFADPATTVQTFFLNIEGKFWPYAVYFYGALSSLLLALILGRIFCGWLCPYGCFSEILHNFRNLANEPLKNSKRNFIWWLKVSLIIILYISAFFSLYPVVSLFSFPGELSTAPILFWNNAGILSVGAIFILPVFLLLIEYFTKKRIWCTRFCPQSIFLGFSAWAMPRIFPSLRINWKPKDCHCKKNSPCAQACSINLNPRSKGGPPRRDCFMCGACVQACRGYGKGLKFSLWSREYRRPE